MNGENIGIAATLSEGKKARELERIQFNSTQGVDVDKFNAERWRDWSYNWQELLTRFFEGCAWLLDHIIKGFYWIGERIVEVSIVLFQAFVTGCIFFINTVLFFLSFIVKGFLILLSILAPMLRILLQWALFLLFIALVLYSIWWVLWQPDEPYLGFLFGSGGSSSNSVWTDNGTKVYTSSTTYSSNNEEETKQQEPQQDTWYTNILQSFNYTVNSAAASVNQVIGEKPPPIVIDRPIVSGGRCDDINNIDNGEYCVTTTRKPDIIWNLQNRSSDYNKLPDTLKKRNYETITIPLVEDSGYYKPDCTNSYYTNTKEKTGLLENLDNKTCRYVPINTIGYEGEYIKKGIKVDSYRST